VLSHALAMAGVRRLTFYLRDLEPPPPEPPAATVSSVVVRPLSQADLDAYRGLRPQGAAGELERRWRRGDRCLAAWREDRLISVFWLATREAPITYLGLSIPLEDGAWFAYDAFTATEERGRGLHELLRVEAFGLMREERVAGFLYAVLPENRDGRRLVSPYTRRLGTMLSIRLGRRRLTRSGMSSAHLGRPTAASRGRFSPLAFGRWTLS
jgi:hypothetical protein